MAIDPILLEVLRNRLDAIADEMELTLLKSAASPIVKEGLDASAALFNTQGETIAQAAAIPIHLGALQFAAQRLVRAFPPERMRDGDAFLLNDPYDGGTHLPDITLAVPVFADGRVVALACTMCHHQDVGGRTPGSVPTDATELYQEGVIIPPTQLFRAGVLDENLFRLLTRNVRLPDVFTGDLMAQVAAGRLGGMRLRELFAAHGAATVVAYIDELLSRAERLTRAQIADIPDGDYAFADWLDDDGVDIGRPVKIAVTLRVRGSAMTFDFTGSDPQVRGPFNSVPASTMSAVYYAVRAISDAVDPEQRRLLPRRRRDPAGGDDREPAAAGAGELPDGDHQAHRRHDPRRAGRRPARPHAGGELGHAAGDGLRRPRPRDRAAVRGQRAGRRRHGGAARQGRHRRHRDRRVELHEHPGRVGGDELPAAHPARAPVDGLGRRRALPRRSRAGEGLRGDDDGRDGLPSRRALRVIARGVSRAARPGARAHAHIVRADGTREELPSKKMIVLHPGDQLWEYIAGGAGYGDPLDREPAAVLADLLDGKISAAGAALEYGVVLDAGRHRGGRGEDEGVAGRAAPDVVMIPGDRSRARTSRARPGAAAATAAELGRALQDVGFFVIVNHGIPPALIDDTFAEARRFHAQPMDAKLALRMNEHNNGYMMLGRYAVWTSDVNANDKPDLNEAFFVKRERGPDDPLVRAGRRFAGPNQWPAAPARLSRDRPRLHRGRRRPGPEAPAPLRGGPRPAPGRLRRRLRREPVQLPAHPLPAGGCPRRTSSASPPTRTPTS